MIIKKKKIEKGIEKQIMIFAITMMTAKPKRV